MAGSKNAKLFCENCGAEVKKKEFKIEGVNKAILSKYFDLEEKNKEKPQLQSFESAFKGYFRLKSEGKINKEILTIIDFTQSSTEKRMWVIDMKKNEIIFQTVVSHGRNSGKEQIFFKILFNHTKI